MTGENKSQTWQKVLPLLITAACFFYLYIRLDRAAVTESRATLQLGSRRLG